MPRSKPLSPVRLALLLAISEGNHRVADLEAAWLAAGGSSGQNQLANMLRMMAGTYARRHKDPNHVPRIYTVHDPSRALLTSELRKWTGTKSNNGGGGRYRHYDLTPLGQQALRQALGE